MAVTVVMRSNRIGIQQSVAHILPGIVKEHAVHTCRLVEVANAFDRGLVALNLLGETYSESKFLVVQITQTTDAIKPPLGLRHFLTHGYYSWFCWLVGLTSDLSRREEVSVHWQQATGVFQ